MLMLLQVGWKYGPIVAGLEEKRKARNKKTLVSKKKATNALWSQARKKALETPAVKAASERLTKLGYTQ